MKSTLPGALLAILSGLVHDGFAADDLAPRTSDSPAAQRERSMTLIGGAIDRGRPLSLAAAKQLVASDAAWKSDVTYRVFQQGDGAWCLLASRRVGNKLQIRILPLIPESIPEDMRSRS
jgi:hypothetical protein